MPSNEVQCQSQWAEATLCQRACATDYMQMVMNATGVVLKIPVEWSCSKSQLMYQSKGSVQVLHLAPHHENIWGAGGRFHAYFTLPWGGGDIKKRETGQSTDQTGGWVGPRGSLEAIEKTKFSLLCPESNPNSSINQPFTLLLLWLDIKNFKKYTQFF
jgi:hypothetical protein